MSKRVVVLGAGPGGYVAAIRAAQLGAEVTVVEAQSVGGTCLNWGCIPSKVLVTASETMRKMHHAKAFGITLPQAPVLDMNALHRQKSGVIATQVKGIEGLLAHHAIPLISGRGTIAGHGRLDVALTDGTQKTLLWDALILATGTRPFALSQLPFDGERILSSDHALTLPAIPESVVIAGGGVIGCEFASILSGFGARVTLVEAAPRILPFPGLARGISKLLAREFKKQKIKVLTEKTVTASQPTETGVSVTIGPSSDAAKPGPPQTIAASCLLVCIGRTPCTNDIGLASVGLVTDEKGWIPVNDQMKTGVDGIYAIGDVTGPDRIMLAHVASMEGRIAAEAIMGGENEMRYDAVPSAIFTSPEVASVGLTEEQALQKGIAARTDSVLFRTLGKAHAIGEIAGEALLVTDTETGRVLGCHMVGPHATDLIGEATLAVEKNLSAKDLADTIHAHPTLTEILAETGLKACDMALHG